MTESGLLAKSGRVLRRIGDAVLPLITLFTRLAMGYEMFITGLGKWRNLDGTVEYFKGLGIPAAGLNAPFVALLELLGGIALFVGLGTRFFALLLSINLLVAMCTAHREQFAECVNENETAG